MEPDSERFRRILIIGDSSVGKTSILLRFTNDQFNPSHITTLGVDIRTKTVNIQGKPMKLQLWDTAGQERYHTITKTFYKDADAIILAYDISREDTFNNIKNWLHQINTHASPNLVKAMVGNKSDLPVDQRVVTLQQGEELARELDIPFLETSALTNQNIEQIFLIVAGELLKRDKVEGPQVGPSARASKLERPPANKKNKGKCC